MSQPSGLYASSSFDTTDGLPLDALQYLIPDDSLSQRESQNYRSRAAPQALSTLPRIKPNRINEFIVCTQEMTAEFVKWWLNTGYKCWKGFQQVANAKDGKPGVMCNKCRTVLTHPATNHTGTSSMQKHLDGPRCRKQLPKKGTSSIQQLLSDAAERRPVPTFTQQTWEQILLNLLTTSHLPFLFVEHQKFRNLFSYARLAPTPPSFPSRKVIRERLRGFVLDKIKASPKNDNAESEWSNDRVRLLRARQQKRDIADTLNKVRGLAVFINGSPQRKEAFLNLKSNGQKLIPIQDAAKDKLSKYYGMTDLVEGDLYVIGTILDPSNKMEFFSISDWAPDNTGKDYKKEYRQILQSLFEKYRLRAPSDISQSDSRLFPAKSALERAIKGDFLQRSTSPQYDELTKYLQSATIDESARIFWRNHEKEFPILISITRDVMSIPATGAGVKRLFNSARDVCHYRRGSLSPETVRDIMLYMCTTRFDTNEEQRLILQEYLSDKEIAASSEELDIKTHCAEAISDTEEDIEIRLDTPAVPPLSEVAARKRPAVTFEDKEDSNADEFADLEENSASPLPDTQHRVSGRMRKRSRLLDGYIV
ncbi:hypothetical protein N7486_003447 [Penicillium sp. IBT 16267x]|nr:hypothetical protein N7486_003447 [Penicillium sp. IBT 16267x]